jgi:hypothetical protein
MSSVSVKASFASNNIAIDQSAICSSEAEIEQPGAEPIMNKSQAKSLFASPHGRWRFAGENSIQLWAGVKCLPIAPELAIELSKVAGRDQSCQSQTHQ